ncbi:MAG: hypothetical protein K2X93_10885 [Candidatus Obscuribacterales bacterium]|nr:hypothetical protein [Candidatus Obscuribacterales bacterium]
MPVDLYLHLGPGGWYRRFGGSGGPAREEPINHSHLKYAAIEVLSGSAARDYDDVYRRLASRFPEFGLAKEGLADALATVVMVAYTMAQYIPEDDAMEALRLGCPYFSGEQIFRIVELATGRRLSTR